jgi:hypothetical protein
LHIQKQITSLIGRFLLVEENTGLNIIYLESECTCRERLLLNASLENIFDDLEILLQEVIIFHPLTQKKLFFAAVTGGGLGSPGDELEMFLK